MTAHRGSRFFRGVCLGFGLGMIVTPLILIALAWLTWLLPLVRLAYALFIVDLERPKSFWEAADSRGDRLVAKTDLSAGRLL